MKAGDAPRVGEILPLFIHVARNMTMTSDSIQRMADRIILSIAPSEVSMGKAMLLLVLAMVAGLPIKSRALPVQENVLYAFPQDGSTGNYPQGAMVADNAGNLYGTTLFGGAFNSNCSLAGCGTVFELSPPLQQGAPWIETVLYEFQGAGDGAGPACTLVRDKYGNLYGTSTYYGAPDGAIVWELSQPAQPGGSWTFTTIYSMADVSLGNPYFNEGNLTIDQDGNLYGTTVYVGDDCSPPACGTVYEVSPSQHSGGSWTGRIIYAFPGGSDGANFATGLIMDKKGDLYGAAWTGSTAIAYQLVPPSQPEGVWTENTLFSFSQIAVFYSLTLDKQGNLYGSSTDGPLDEGCRSRQGCGYVFELSPPQPGGAWTETVLYTFRGDEDGWYPAAAPILDPKGNLYGTTYYGGRDNLGTVYRLAKRSGGSWVEQRFSLAGSAPIYPTGGLIFGPGAAVTGTGTGAFSGGGVFSIGAQ
jgi:uncharacterized repeat protein (TIGR03803 family)